MAKNPYITDEVRQVITEICLKHPDWRAKEIRNAVEIRLHEKNPRSKPGWPGLSAVQKELTKIRRKDDERPPESKALDRPWSVGTVIQYDIASEAVPVLIEIKKIMKHLLVPQALTIREARWASRLRSFNQNARKLAQLSSVYAERELICELIGVDLDTSDIDELALSDVSAARTKIFWESIIQDEEKRVDARSKPQDFTVRGMIHYGFWLDFISNMKRWKELTTEQRRAITISLQDWAKEIGEEETGRSPYKIVGELDPELAREMQEQHHKSFEEEPDERSHSQKR